MLPLTGGRAAVIWTLPTADAERIAALPTDEFRAELQAVFGFRLGRITRIGDRHMHPLARVASGAVHRRPRRPDRRRGVAAASGRGAGLQSRVARRRDTRGGDRRRAAARAPRRRRPTSARRAARALSRVARGRSAPRVDVHARLDSPVRRRRARARPRPRAGAHGVRPAAGREGAARAANDGPRGTAAAARARLALV